MSLLLWCLYYSIELAFYSWLIFWGGAQWIERRFIAGFLLNYCAITWSAEQIKLYCWLLLIARTCWFVAGWLVPELRFGD